MAPKVVIGKDGSRDSPASGHDLMYYVLFYLCSKAFGMI
jgi:hypothetical protein